MALIYCVEDEENIRDLIAYALRNRKHEVKTCVDGEELMKALDIVPDLILLDVMLPGEDGFQILHRLREDPRLRSVRIIMVTAKDTEWDAITGLEGGADDYIRKPFGIMELLARVEAVLRRGSVSRSRLNVADIELDEAAHTVLLNGEPVELRAKEFELLAYLMRNAGIVVTREQMMMEVWDVAQWVESRTIDMHIMSLRQKLGPAGRYIQTIRGVGYRMDQ